MKKTEYLYAEQMEQLCKLPTEELDQILQAELRKEYPHEEVVLPILRILEQREYPEEFANSDTVTPIYPRKRKLAVGIAAVAAALVIVLVTIPKVTGSNSMLDVLVGLSDSVLQFFSPGDDPADIQKEYVFETDHPGLQQLHNEVTTHDVTVPIVPMWLPEGFELTELKTTQVSDEIKIYACFMRDEKSIAITYRISKNITKSQYERENGEASYYNIDGISHALVENDGRWTASWVKAPVECMIVADLKIEDLRKTIKSIYGRIE